LTWCSTCCWSNQTFSRTCNDLANYSQSLHGWLDHFSTAVQSLHAHVAPDKIVSLPGKVLLEKESRQWSKLNKQLYAYHFDLMNAQRHGGRVDGRRAGRAKPGSRFCAALSEHGCMEAREPGHS